MTGWETAVGRLWDHLRAVEAALEAGDWDTLLLLEAPLPEVDVAPQDGVVDELVRLMEATEALERRVARALLEAEVERDDARRLRAAAREYLTH